MLRNDREEPDLDTPAIVVPLLILLGKMEVLAERFAADVELWDEENEDDEVVAATIGPLGADLLKKF